MGHNNVFQGASETKEQEVENGYVEDFYVSGICKLYFVKKMG
jgi:hypothetical protein